MVLGILTVFLFNSLQFQFVYSKCWLFCITLPTYLYDYILNIMVRMASAPAGSKQPNESEESSDQPTIDTLSAYERNLGVDEPQSVDEFVDSIAFREFFPEQYGDFSRDDIRAHRRWAQYWYEREEPVIPADELSGDGWIAGQFRDNPLQAMFSATICYRAVTLDSAYVSVEDIESVWMNIEDVRAEHIGTLQTFEVQVTNRSKTYPRVYEVAYRCPDCASVQTAYQPRFETNPVKPSQPCDCDAGLVRDESRDEYYSAREVLLQDLHRRVDVSEPADLVSSVDCDLVGMLESGDTVRVAAIVRADTSSDEMSADYHLQVVGIDHQEEDFSAVDISDEDLEDIEKLVERDDIHEVLAQSIAPSVVGKGRPQYDVARQALIHQLAGGVRMQMGDDEERGVIHVALVGDPGTAKSTLAEAAYRIAPKAEKASGESTTAVGFTATAHRQERFRTSEWTLTGGVLPRAHNGLAVIDELDKAPVEHQEALHTPLSEGEIAVAKANINATLAARASALVVANPENQRFDPYESITDQIGIKDALFSRFDIVVPFVDEPDGDLDKGIMSKYRMMAEGDAAVVSESLLRKYFAVAREIDPELSENAIKYLEEEYSNLREQSQGRKRVSVTARKGEAMRRLAQASARLRMSDTVDIEDMERARDLLVSSLEMLNEGGELDADRLGPGPSAAQRETMEAVEEIVQGLHEASGSGVEEGRVVEAAREQDIPRHNVVAALSRLQKQNVIWNNHTGYGHMDN